MDNSHICAVHHWGKEDENHKFYNREDKSFWKIAISTPIWSHIALKNYKKGGTKYLENKFSHVLQKPSLLPDVIHAVEIEHF